VETFGLPLLKAKGFPESYVPNCEGWASARKRGISPEMAAVQGLLRSAESSLVQQAQYNMAYVRGERLKLKRLELVRPVCGYS